MTQQFSLRHIVLFFFVLACANGLAQDNEPAALDSLLSPGKMRRDLDSLKSVLLDTHQDPYFYANKAQVTRAFNMAKKECSKALSVRDFAPIVARVLNVLEDSHTYLEYKSLLSRYNAVDGRYVGFRITTIQGKIYVKEDRLDLLPPGAQLIAVNHNQASFLFNEISRLSVQEGQSNTGRTRIAEILFGRFLGVYGELKAENTITYKPFDSDSTLSIQYPAYTSKEWKSRNKKLKSSSPINLEFSDNADLAILSISSFSKGKNRSYYKDLERAFKQVKKAGVQHLAIDLRGNTGGQSERMEELFAYISEDTICSPTNIIARQSELSQERFAKNMSPFAAWLMRKFGGKSEDVVNYTKMMDLPVGAMDTVYYSEGEHVKDKRRFKGTTHLIINGSSGSASSNFAGSFSMYMDGEIWGESCLGPLGGTWGNPAKYELPYSNIGVYISTIRFNNSDDFLNDRAPVRPSMQVQYTPEDLALERDPVIAAIEAFISKGK